MQQNFGEDRFAFVVSKSFLLIMLGWTYPLWDGSASSRRYQPVFPISAKKCKKCKIFSGIFALKFCEFRHFFSCQKPVFLFATKNRRQLWFTRLEARRKLAEFRRRTFFFWDQHKIREKDASISAMIFCFSFFFWGHIETGRNDE